LCGALVAGATFEKRKVQEKGATQSKTTAALTKSQGRKRPRMSPTTVVVGEGAQRYFTHDDGSSSPSSTWTLPADQLDDWLLGLKEKAKAERERVANGVGVNTSGESIAARNLTKALASDIKKKANVTVNSGDWVVRVHPDTGQVYYENSVSNESTWFNPLLDFGQVVVTLKC
jgi:hypothetical protein